ncbi:hypothetical protein I4U23_015156 [Adineta vaga]|nr:hypothetical protein I4U23_015156 [Adineta vaga]
MVRVHLFLHQDVTAFRNKQKSTGNKRSIQTFVASSRLTTRIKKKKIKQRKCYAFNTKLKKSKPILRYIRQKLKYQHYYPSIQQLYRQQKRSRFEYRQKKRSDRARERIRRQNATKPNGK